MSRLTWKETLLSLLSGVLTALAMPGVGVFPLVFVSLVPFFSVLDRRGGFWPGFLFGLAFFGIDLRWMIVLIRFQPIVIAGYILLVVYFAIGCGILGAIISWRIRSRVFTWLVLAAALFMLAEYLRTLGALGMGFSSLYLSLYRVPWLIQSAAILGPWFISGMLVAVNGSLYLLLRKRDYRFALPAIGLVIMLAAFGLLPPMSHQVGSMQVAVVTSTVQQEVKMDVRNLDDLTARYLQLGEQAIRAEPDLVVFPESILPAYILQNKTLKNSFAGLARRGGTKILLGTGSHRNSNIYNTVALFSETGELVATFDKIRLVPFGEYFPGRTMLERLGLGDLVRSFKPRDLSRGDAYLPVGEFGTPICFESTFTGPSRLLTNRGAQLLVTVTNDAWFVGSSALITHFSCAVFRAVENRRWFIRSANGGISGIISPTGHIMGTLNAEGVLVGEVGLQAGISPYTRWGDLIMLVVAGLAVGWTLLERVIRNHVSGGEIR